MRRETAATALRPNPAGDRPRVGPGAWLDPTAQVIGRVEIGPRVFVGPGAVVRADETGPAGTVEPVLIGAECNLQDGVIVHALGGTGVTVGARTSLSHGAIVHGPCTVGPGCFVGFRAVLFRARLGEGVFVGAGAVVQGVDLPDGRLVPPGAVVLTADEAAGLPQTGPREREFMQQVVAANLRLVEGYGAAAERDR